MVVRVMLVATVEPVAQQCCMDIVQHARWPEPQPLRGCARLSLRSLGRTRCRHLPVISGSAALRSQLRPQSGAARFARQRSREEENLLLICSKGQGQAAGKRLPHAYTFRRLADHPHVRETKVILDRDLAKLYGVLTKRLNEAARRNADRFPAEFCFQLTLQRLQT